MIKILQKNHKICKNYKKKNYKRIYKIPKNYKRIQKLKKLQNQRKIQKRTCIYISMKLICQLYFVT